MKGQFRKMPVKRYDCHGIFVRTFPYCSIVGGVKPEQPDVFRNTKQR